MAAVLLYTRMHLDHLSELHCMCSYVDIYVKASYACPARQMLYVRAVLSRSQHNVYPKKCVSHSSCQLLVRVLALSR